MSVRNTLAPVVLEPRRAGVRGGDRDAAVHDFMMLNPLSGTHATRAAIPQAVSVLRTALHGDA